MLLLTLVFPPDGVSTAVLMGELAQEWARMGRKVTVLTTTPHYTHDSAARARQPLTRHAGGLYYTSDFHGIRVYHAPVMEKGKNIFSRLWNYVVFQAVCLWLGMRQPRPELVFAPSPPFTVAIVAWLLGLWHRVPNVYNVQEIYPDISVQLGVIRNRQLIWGLHRLEDFIYARATVVSVISEWFRRNLLAKGVPAKKLRVIPNFVDGEFIQPGEKDNPLAREYALQDKFVVLYSGNLGFTQNLELLLASARALQEFSEFVLLLGGDGNRRAWLEAQLAGGQYPNVRLLPYLPRERIGELYALSDVCLVPLIAGTASQTFPSKIYTIMAAGRPVIATAEADTELAWVVGQAQCGWALDPLSETALGECLRQAIGMTQAQLRQLGQNGREYVVAHHSKQSVAQQYEQLFQQLTKK